MFRHLFYSLIILSSAASILPAQTTKPASDASDAIGTVTVHNPTDHTWSDVPAAIGSIGVPAKELLLRGPEILPAQHLENKSGTGEVLFLVSLSPGETKEYDLIYNNIGYESPDRAHAGMYKPGFEGPGWETDRLAFRLYWDERNATDIFAKRTSVLGLEKYASKDVNYHQDTPWGMDVLKVGTALGVGGFGIWHDGKVHKVADAERDYEVLFDGPLAAAISLKYDNWKVEDRAYHLTADILTVAGQNYAITKLTLTPLDGGEMSELVTGIVKHENTELVKSDKLGYMGRWGQQALGPGEKPKGAKLGIGVVVPPKQIVEFGEDEVNSYVRLKPQMINGKGVVTYKSHASWEHEPGAARSIEDYEAKLSKLAQLNVKTKTEGGKIEF